MWGTLLFVETMPIQIYDWCFYSDWQHHCEPSNKSLISQPKQNRMRCLSVPRHFTNLGLYSLSRKTSYRKISWSLEAARFGFKLFQSLWNLAGTSASLLPRCLSNFRAIRPLQHPISRLRDFTRFGGKTSYRLVNRGPGFDFDPIMDG